MTPGFWVFIFLVGIPIARQGWSWFHFAEGLALALLVFATVIAISIAPERRGE